jgi:CBS domain-containing protein
MGIKSTVRDIIEQKHIKGALVIDPHASVYEALDAMAKFNVGALLVVEDEELVGIFTERDYSRKIVLNSQSSKTTLVSDVMQAGTCNVTTDDTAECCLSLMTDNHVRHLPVYEKGELVGIISMGDVVKAVINDSQFMIDQLTCYVTGATVSHRATYW